jgi:competence protein ComEC
MAYEFGRFGLQHIMAISGFHFAIIASILGLFLRLFFSKRKVCLLLIFLLSSYFVFLGCGPSILRAWISISIALGGFLLCRRAIGLNSLGVAMIAVLIYDPLMWQSIGFQFSFITTAAILLLFSGCDRVMQSLFAKRSLSLTVNMNSINQHGYCVLTTIRQALALTVAVNLVALPLMLFYFHKFPWMSLAYNLFFPFLVSISMLMLLLGTLVHAILPPLGEIIHSLNSHFTYFMLNYTYQMPVTVDFVWRVESISMGWLILYLCIVFSAGIWLRSYNKDAQEFEFV